MMMLRDTRMWLCNVCNGKVGLLMFRWLVFLESITSILTSMCISHTHIR